MICAPSLVLSLRGCAAEEEEVEEVVQMQHAEVVALQLRAVRASRTAEARYSKNPARARCGAKACAIMTSSRTSCMGVTYAHSCGMSFLAAGAPALHHQVLRCLSPSSSSAEDQSEVLPHPSQDLGSFLECLTFFPEKNKILTLRLVKKG